MWCSSTTRDLHITHTRATAIMCSLRFKLEQLRSGRQPRKEGREQFMAADRRRKSRETGNIRYGACAGCGELEDQQALSAARLCLEVSGEAKQVHAVRSSASECCHHQLDRRARCAAGDHTAHSSTSGCCTTTFSSVCMGSAPNKRSAMAVSGSCSCKCTVGRVYSKPGANA